MDASHADAAMGATKIVSAWLLFTASILVPALTAAALLLTIVFTSFQIVKIVRDLQRQKRIDDAKDASGPHV